MPPKVQIKTVKTIPVSCAAGILQHTADPEKSGLKGVWCKSGKNVSGAATLALEKPSTLCNIDTGNPNPGLLLQGVSLYPPW